MNLCETGCLGGRGGRYLSRCHGELFLGHLLLTWHHTRPTTSCGHVGRYRHPQGLRLIRRAIGKFRRRHSSGTSLFLRLLSWSGSCSKCLCQDISDLEYLVAGSSIFRRWSRWKYRLTRLVAGCSTIWTFGTGIRGGCSCRRWKWSRRLAHYRIHTEPAFAVEAVSLPFL